MWAPSDDSGVTIPGENVWRNTACGASFYTFDSERYQMVTDFQRLRDMAAHVPYDYIYVLSNTQKYGGGGIFNFYGISAAHHPTRTGKIHVHEFGHLLLGLGDEYVGTTSYDDMYAKSIEPWEPNLTTLVAAFVLLYFGTGPVRGFAVTLAIGIATSMFTSVTVTRLIITGWLQKYKPTKLPI